MSQLPTQRHLFDIPEQVAYFNSAYNSPQLQAAQKALIQGVKGKTRPWERAPEHFFEDAETVRKLASNLFGGDAEAYAIVPAASYGISSAARAIEPHLSSGDEILVLQDEFPSNVLPWRRVSHETGAKIVTVPKPENLNWTESILESVNAQTRVLALSTCLWTDGTKIDIESIAGQLDRDRICVVLDVTQTLGAVPFSMELVEPDFLVAAGYKWLLCPYGSGVMYVSHRWRNARPLEETWLVRDNAQNFSELATYSDTYLSGARRFDVGETCVPTILPGTIKALEQLTEWGIHAVAVTLGNINQDICDFLISVGFGVPDEGNRLPHMFGATVPKGYEGNLQHRLASQNIYISRRADVIRIAPHLHINRHDIHRLKSVISKEVA